MDFGVVQQLEESLPAGMMVYAHKLTQPAFYTHIQKTITSHYVLMAGFSPGRPIY